MGGNTELVKICIIGNSKVGKSVINHQIQTPTDHISLQYKATIGLDFSVKEYTCSDQTPYRAEIWDTAGNELFAARGMGLGNFRGTRVIFAVFNVTDKKSFEDFKAFLNQHIADHPDISPNAIQYVIVGNHFRGEERRISLDDAKAYANEKGAGYVEVDATDPNQVMDILFKPAMEKFHQRNQKQQAENEKMSQPVPIPEALRIALTKHKTMLENRWFERRILSYIFRTGYTSKQKVDEINHFLNGKEAFDEKILLQGRTE